MSMDGPTCSMDPWIGSDIGVCLSGVDRSNWCPWMVQPVPWSISDSQKCPRMSMANLDNVM